jgi:hypothetical protein
MQLETFVELALGVALITTLFFTLYVVEYNPHPDNVFDGHWEWEG